jgi:hypothetical protein
MTDHSEERDNSKMFNKENRIYKYYVNSLETSPVATDFVKSLFELEIMDIDKSKNQDLVQLYEAIGFDKFFEVVALFSSRTIKLPRIDKIKKLLTIAIAYYQIEMLHMSPKDVGRLLSEKLGLFNLKQKSLKSIVKELQQTIDDLAETVYNQVNRDLIESGKEPVLVDEEVDKDE